MATIKVFDVDGVKELNCFDTLSEIPYIVEEESSDESEDEDTLNF